MMKKYHLFCHIPYSSSGANDYIGSYETLEQAMSNYEKKYEEEYFYAEILETQTDGSLKIIAERLERNNSSEKYWYLKESA